MTTAVTNVDKQNIPTTTLTIQTLRESLISESTPLSLRFRALSSLNHFTQHETGDNSLAAIDAIAAALSSPSALLKHELVYCLGQSGNLVACEPLRRLLADLKEDIICRHEAAEALGALGDTNNLDILKEFRDSNGENVVIKETCKIAIDRIGWVNSEAGKKENLHQSDFDSVDPAPPFPRSTQTIHDLEKALIDKEAPLFQRYRAMFTLRNLASPSDLPTAVPAVLSLTRGFADSSVLFRHEIAFVLGQLSHPASINALTIALNNTDEDSIVRHEAADALGSMREVSGVDETLRRFIHDEDRVVRESVIVALDLVEEDHSN